MQTDSFAEIGSFASRLAQLRGLRGELISPKELRYVDLQRTEKTEQEVAAAPESLARMRCGVLRSVPPTVIAGRCSRQSFAALRR